MTQLRLQVTRKGLFLSVRQKGFWTLSLINGIEEKLIHFGSTPYRGFIPIKAHLMGDSHFKLSQGELQKKVKLCY